MRRESSEKQIEALRPRSRQGLVFEDGFESGDLVGWEKDKYVLSVKYTGHERERFKNLDYMLGRHYSHVTNRFMSVDPARDGWNLYSYVRNSPISYNDPYGLAVSIIFDFSGVDLSESEQSQIMQNIRAIFVSAGVEDVRVFHKQQGIKAFFSFSDGTPRVEGNHHKFNLDFVSSIGTSGNVLGKANIITNNRSGVSVEYADEPAGVTQISNTAAHEAAHQTDLYLFDATGGPSGEEGTIMEQGVSVKTQGESLRRFSESDAKFLREKLNDDPSHNE